MLQQILSDMFIDPELLAELSDEQKQILFCKMREEQVKRWSGLEKEYERKSVKKLSLPKPNRKGQCVGFLLGKDGDPWTWVMGEHKHDKSIEQILEEEAREKARQLAEREAAALDNRVTQPQMKEKRADELLSSLKERRQQILRQAEESSKKEEEVWKEQERKAKEAEHQIRAMARRAREEHRRNSLKSGTNNNRHHANGHTNRENGRENGHVSTTPVIRQHRTRPAKPPSRDAVVEWFKKEERIKGAGIDPATNRIAVWFHGIISRAQAESMLSQKSVGSFLVRVSERVWGYAVSYKSAERCKHFLIDTGEATYQFFGNNQIAHERLSDLITYHRSNPISVAGQELLLEGCGQVTTPADYSELFIDETTGPTFV